MYNDFPRSEPEIIIPVEFYEQVVLKMQQLIMLSVMICDQISYGTPDVNLPLDFLDNKLIFI